MNKKVIEFDGILEEPVQSPQSGAVLFPYDMTETFGKKSVKVKMTFDGIPYRGLLKSMGGGKVYCLILKEIRRQLGKPPGELVHVRVEEDTAERIIVIPEDFNQVLQSNPEVRTFFEQLSYTCRKEYVVWIDSAKKTETRNNRLEKALVMLKQKIKSPH
jgi:hypothetical protein